MYIIQIVWLLTWPLLIAVAWLLVRFAVKKFERHLPPGE